MIEELRARFRTRFIETARSRVRRALELIGSADGARELMTELHSLAGEAALLGLSEISDEARSGELAAREWTEGDDSAKLRCVRAVRMVSRQIEAFAGEDAEQVAEPAEAEDASHAHRVLVVDDSTLSGEHVSDALSDAGVATRLATDPVTAVAAIKAFAPHVVLTDVHMPGVELDRLCCNLREAAPAPILIILLSGMSEDNLGTRAREVAADGYITKQRGIDHVVERLQLILRESGR